jgi:ribonuclease HI
MIHAAIDGSSLGNPGPSGWAWYVDDSCWAAGGWAYGTNNKGELQALIELLEATKHSEEPLLIYCDSRYVIDSCQKWIPQWKKRGWRTADNKTVKNLDQMKAIDLAVKGRDFTFQWVHGHTGHPLNDKADGFAHAAATAYQDGTPVARGPGFPRPVGAVEVPEGDPEPQDDTTDYNSPRPEVAEALSVTQPELDGFNGWDPGQASLSVDLTELTRELMGDEIQLDRERLSELLHPEFVAHLPEGAIRTKGSILARPASLMGTVHLDVYGSDRLADDVVLLRFRMEQNSQDFLCAVLWQRTQQMWQARFQHVAVVG